jgi:LAS superfamily LD-carboxypeptidase LdcB
MPKSNFKHKESLYLYLILTVHFVVFGILALYGLTKRIQVQASNQLVAQSYSRDSLSFPSIQDAMSAVITFPLVPFQTSDPEILITLESNKPLKTGQFEGYILRDGIEKDQDFTYSYILGIQNLSYGQNEKQVVLLDVNGHEIKATLSIERLKKGKVLGETTYKQPTSEKVWDNGDDLTAVVDKEYTLTKNYYPSDLGKLVDNGIPSSNVFMLRKVVMEDLKTMFSDAQKDGIIFSVLSAYRSYDLQAVTYNNWVKSIGQYEADRASARPGHSEHQLGTTIDFTSTEVKNGISNTFINTKAGKWLHENAYKYGFVMSYPLGSEVITGYKFEPWHYRYVGKELANDIYASGEIPVVYLKRIHGIH